MFQRTMHRSPAVADRRRPPWPLLVESPASGVDIADFTAFRCAGFEVSVCGGPTADASECPAVRGEPCPLLDEADVVLFDLDSDLSERSAVLAAIRASRPDLPIVVRSNAPPSAATPTDPTIRTTTSVNGQIAALQKAVLRWPGPRA
jgi:hypothetical protein